MVLFLEAVAVAISTISVGDIQIQKQLKLQSKWAALESQHVSSSRVNFSLTQQTAKIVTTYRKTTVIMEATALVEAEVDQDQEISMGEAMELMGRDNMEDTGAQALQLLG